MQRKKRSGQHQKARGGLPFSTPANRSGMGMAAPLHLTIFLLLIPISAAAFTPTSATFLACGAAANVSLPQDNPPRSFLPDAPFLLSSSTSVATANSPSPLHDSLRFSSSPFSYSISIAASPADVLLRLHFFSSPPQLSSPALFSVAALGRYQLLSNFSPPASQETLTEFFLYADSPDFTLQFTPAHSASVAFVSAIELFTSPPELLSDASPTLLPNAAPLSGGLARQALETLYRINVGGPLITPANDTLWRTWIPDDPFLFLEAASVINTTTQKIYYNNASGLTPQIAPVRVYDTARTMRLGLEAQLNNFNLTWRFPVSRGYRYLVRLHFCDFISPSRTSVTGAGLVFNVYVMGFAAVGDLTPKDVTSQPAEAFYVDVVTDVVADVDNITVSVGPSADGTILNALLNGLEILKLNNSVASLDGAAAAAPGTSSSPNTLPLGVILGAVLGAAAFTCIVIAIVVVVCRRRRRGGQLKPLLQFKTSNITSWTSTAPNAAGSNSDGPPASNATPKVNLGLLIPFSELKAATSNFSERNLLGIGGFGRVYKGVLSDGTPVAVKRGTRGSRQGFPEFQTEIVVLSRIRHRHLVSLVGYCDEHSEMILVYEFMGMGTLRSCLYGGSAGAHLLTWKQRLEICIGAARGLHYLHTGYSDNIIHRDVKSTNILLGEGFVAKVSDFGLSRLGPSYGETHVSTAVKGSFGYLDPEYFKTQKLTDKSDVYSFGVVLFEVLCARPVIDQSRPHSEINLAEWALGRQRRGDIASIVDPALQGSVNENSLRNFGETAAKCLAEFGVDRPGMSDVLWNLEYCLQLQTTEVRREAYEDSGDVETLIPVPPARPMPTGIVAEEEETADGTSTSMTQVFSQLKITNVGR